MTFLIPNSILKLPPVDMFYINVNNSVILIGTNFSHSFQGAKTASSFLVEWEKKDDSIEVHKHMSMYKECTHTHNTHEITTQTHTE